MAYSSPTSNSSALKSLGPIAAKPTIASSRSATIVWNRGAADSSWRRQLAVDSSTEIEASCSGVKMCA